MPQAACLLMPCASRWQNFCCLAGVNFDGLPALPLDFAIVLLLVCVVCVVVKMPAIVCRPCIIL